MKRLAASLTVLSLALVSTNSFAWFQICNDKADSASMYVTYAYYEPKATTVYTDECGSHETVFSPQYFETWQNTGWWYLTANQCATVYGSALSNTWGYVYAQISDGSTLTGANTPFTVSDVAFTLDQYTSGPYGTCNNCVEQQGFGDCGNPQPTYWSVNTLPVNQGSYQNYTLTID